MSTPPETPAPPKPVARPKLVRLPALPPAGTVYHRIRARFHLIFFLVFVTLPFFDVMRFDLPRKRFFFGGVELWINEFGILFFSLMFLMFLIAASALVWGRIYCGYACPQTIFSEWSVRVEHWAAKLVNKRRSHWSPRHKHLVAKGIFYSVLGVASMFLAFCFTAYFVEPRDLLSRLIRLDIETAAGITGATVTLLTFLDFAFVRQRFCTTVCPYGYLQGMLQDSKTLLVTYIDGTDGNRICIECKKCVRDCPMEIDIRESAYQIECIHCGECIDSCETVLRKIGRPGLIHYAWGETTPTHAAREPWLKRLGFRDAKRVAILFVLGFYLAGLSVALSMRRPVMVRVQPDRTVLYTKLPDGRIVNKLRINLANRSRQPAAVAFRVEGLPGAELALERNPLLLAPAEALERTYELRVPRWAGAPDVNRFRLIAQPSNEKTPDIFSLTFIMPVEKRNP